MYQCSLEGGQSARADMVFNPFGIHFRYAIRDAKRTEKSGNRLMPVFASGCQRLSLLGEENSAIWLRVDKSGFF
jgi:hypothetical protein